MINLKKTVTSIFIIPTIISRDKLIDNNFINGYIQNVPNQVLENLVNFSDQPITTQPTQDTQYEVMLKYTDSTEAVTWLLQEHGTFKRYTLGIHSLDATFEGHIGDCATGSVTINLPTASAQKGKRYYFVKLGSSHTMTINAYTSQTINGADHTDLTGNYYSCTLICDGTQWFIIAAHP